MPARPGRRAAIVGITHRPGPLRAHHGGTTAPDNGPAQAAGIFTESGSRSATQKLHWVDRRPSGMAAPIRRAGMPGRLEPLRQPEELPGAAPVQAVSPVRPARRGPARAGCDPQQEIFLARQIRARGLVAGLQPGQIAAKIRAWYVSEGRIVPRFSETLLSAYESGQKRPGPEYLHYLCAVYRADPPDLGYPDPCFCGRGHGEKRPARAPAGPGAAAPGGPAGHPPATPGHPGSPGPGLA